jgi:hypothetical protein
MQSLFGDYSQRPREEKVSRDQLDQWLNFGLGLIGSFVICYLLIGRFEPEIARVLGVSWLQETPARIAASGIVSLLMALVLSRIDGTLWGKYYAVIVYLLSFAFLVVTVLYMLRVI